MNKEIQHWAERFKNMQFATINERKDEGDKRIF